MIRCLLFGHKPFRLQTLGRGPLILIQDITGGLVEIHICERCHLVFWRPAQPGYSRPNDTTDSVEKRSEE